MLSKINFVVNEEKLREMAYGDAVYAWLLLNSHYDPDENHNYIYANEFTFTDIAKSLGKTRQTVSKRFKELLNRDENGKQIKSRSRDFIIYNPAGKYYILPCFKVFEKLDSETVLNLFRLCSKAPRREELVKTYAWLKKQFAQERKEISLTDLIDAFGHSRGNEETYNRYKDILTTLQGAGLVKFRTDLTNYRKADGTYCKTFYVYQVNEKASQEWLDKNRD